MQLVGIPACEEYSTAANALNCAEVRMSLPSVTYNLDRRLCLYGVSSWPILHNNNNNNNNKHDNVYGAVIMAEPLREFTRFI